MANVIFRPQAYCKIILHAAKYPHCSVNGLLLANRRGKHDAQTDLYIEDAIPLFHICLHVSPMTEVALTMVRLIFANIFSCKIKTCTFFIFIYFLRLCLFVYYKLEFRI